MGDYNKQHGAAEGRGIVSNVSTVPPNPNGCMPEASMRLADGADANDRTTMIAILRQALRLPY